MSGWIHIFDGAPVREIESGAYLFRREEAVRSMFLVRAGAVALERPLEDGTPLTLHVATPGTALAEASLFAATYHCDAVARSEASIANLPRVEFLTALRSEPDAALSLVETHAKEVQAQRARIETLRLRRVADRLDAWLDLHGEPRKGRWTEVANQIGVSPPALYRELARRRSRKEQ
ncbi:Crp/Fnr family transcriptional regulator [Jannaschia sp. S6380]|uniref:Crp/Fnr family transcriptional regulator n=1 Tax=Jannaschia sp. S6380 TaxID=2926408 RepID=UPI001FF552BA|nr:Crp/Fnr family transcriptional regulator [Jannaschia sp. S6380]MCK0166698.1 Crp/Fnr family transcriptional regulator [Jannaschia sp. S6380]